jgi:hypothetical protein
MVLFFPLGLGVGNTVYAFELQADNVLWSRLSYRASGIFGKLTTDVQLNTVPVEGTADLLIADPAGDALPPAGATLLTLTVYSEINPLLGSNEVLKTQSWFEPNNARALQRIRLRLGKDKWQKSYRFTKSGVFRLRSKPQDSSEENLSPDRWTKVRNHFYPYGDYGSECAQILEPASLLYIASAIALTPNQSPLTLCVFDKKQLHQVKVFFAGNQSLKVNYFERVGDRQTQVDQNIDTIKISFQPRSLSPPKIEPEEFSFLGLKGDFVISIDKKSKIPVQVSGKISTFGKIDIILQEVNFSPNDK